MPIYETGWSGESDCESTYCAIHSCHSLSYLLFLFKNFSRRKIALITAKERLHWNVSAIVYNHTTLNSVRFSCCDGCLYVNDKPSCMKPLSLVAIPSPFLPSANSFYPYTYSFYTCYAVLTLNRTYRPLRYVDHDFSSTPAQ